MPGSSLVQELVGIQVDCFGKNQGYEQFRNVKDDFVMTSRLELALPENLTTRIVAEAAQPCAQVTCKFYLNESKRVKAGCCFWVQSGAHIWDFFKKTRLPAVTGGS